MLNEKEHSAASGDSKPPEAPWIPPQDFAGRVQIFAQTAAALGSMSGGMMIYTAQKEQIYRYSIAVLTDIPMELLHRTDGVDILQSYLFAYGISDSEAKSEWLRQFAEDCAGDVQLRYAEQSEKCYSFDELEQRILEEIPHCSCIKDKNEMGILFRK